METIITCPWCGTSYDTFRSNCKNCGGPTQPAVFPEEEKALQPPPPAPRAISDNYTFKLMQTDARSIVGFVLSILGGTFTLVGIFLTIFLVTAFLGIPFGLLGIFLLLTGGGLLFWRKYEKQKIVDVLKHGQAVRGEVTNVRMNRMVRINYRHPWVIEYQFRANGQVFNGSVSTLRDPAAQFQPGWPIYVLYQADMPEQNALYPHP